MNKVKKFLKNNQKTIAVILLFLLIVTIIKGISDIIIETEDKLDTKEEQLQEARSKNYKLTKKVNEKEEEIKALESRVENTAQVGADFANFGFQVQEVLIELDELVADYDQLVQQYCHTKNHETDSFLFQYDKINSRYGDIVEDFVEIQDNLDRMMPSNKHNAY
ncbi:MAG: hypothetical protein ACOCQR_03380 [bacterium]